MNNKILPASPNTKILKQVNMASDNVVTKTTPAPSFRTKHLNLELHHFRSYINKKRNSIITIASLDQLADLVTKPLPKKKLVDKLRKKIMGWGMIEKWN